MHNEAINNCKILSKSLWQNILMHFICSSSTICIAALALVKSDGIDRLVFITYVCAYIIQIYYYACSGSKLINSSTEIKFSAYNFHWYKCDAKIRKAILMIMIRAHTKVNLEVPFFQVSLETFAWVR